MSPNADPTPYTLPTSHEHHYPSLSLRRPHVIVFLPMPPAFLATHAPWPTLSPPSIPCCPVCTPLPPPFPTPPPHPRELRWESATSLRTPSPHPQPPFVPLSPTSTHLSHNVTPPQPRTTPCRHLACRITRTVAPLLPDHTRRTPCSPLAHANLPIILPHPHRPPSDTSPSPPCTVTFHQTHLLRPS